MTDSCLHVGIILLFNSNLAITGHVLRLLIALTI